MPINNSTLPSREEFLKRKRKQKITKYFAIGFLLVLIVCVFTYISHRPEVRVSKVILKGGVLVKESQVSEKVFEYTSGSYIFLFPKNSSFWYPKAKLAQYLKTNFRRIENISIDLSDFRTMVVTIEERKPFGIWCDKFVTKIDISTTTEEKSNSYQNCFFLDQNSTIFSEAPYFSGDAYFKYYGSIGTTTPIGNYYIASTTEFNEINDFIDAVRKMYVHPLYLVAKDDGSYSLVVSGNGEILFDMKKPLSEVSQNLQSLLKTPNLSTSTNRDLPIEYIDLRYGNKLFYKLKGEKI